MNTRNNGEEKIEFTNFNIEDNKRSRKSEGKSYLLNERIAKSDENLIYVYYIKGKQIIWDPLTYENKVLCLCSSVCLIFIFLALFYAFLIKG